MFCPNCGAETPEEARFCRECGADRQNIRTTIASPTGVRYGGFWKRFVAAIIDGILTAIVTFIVGFIIGFVFASGGVSEAAAVGFAQLAGIAISWIYFAGMESSSSQATLGKQAMGIRVSDLQGHRISFGRATGRHFAKIISILILLIGYLMIAFTEKKQGLHDKMAGCLVVS